MFREGVGWWTRTSPAQLLFKNTLSVKLFMSHRHPEQNERKQTVITETITTQVNSLLTRLILCQITLFQFLYPMPLQYFVFFPFEFYSFYTTASGVSQRTVVLTDWFRRDLEWKLFGSSWQLRCYITHWQSQGPWTTLMSLKGVWLAPKCCSVQWSRYLTTCFNSAWRHRAFPHVQRRILTGGVTRSGGRWAQK